MIAVSFFRMTYDIVLIAGGIAVSGGTPYDTTEIVDLSQSESFQPGPTQLPTPNYAHAMIRIDSNSVLFTGGRSAGTEFDAYIYKFDTGKHYFSHSFLMCFVCLVTFMTFYPIIQLLEAGEIPSLLA